MTFLAGRRPQTTRVFTGMPRLQTGLYDIRHTPSLRTLLPRRTVPQPAEASLLQPGFALGPQTFPGSLALTVPDFRIGAPFQQGLDDAGLRVTAHSEHEGGHAHHLGIGQGIDVQARINEDVDSLRVLALPDGTPPSIAGG